MSTVVSRILETKLPIIYLNMIGGQDEIVFDGGSFVLDQNCKLISQQPQTTEKLLNPFFMCFSVPMYAIVHANMYNTSSQKCKGQWDGLCGRRK